MIKVLQFIFYFVATKVLIVSVCFSVSSADDINPNFYHKVENVCPGKKMTLDLEKVGKNYLLTLTESGNYSGQFWNLIPEEDGYYRLTNQWLENEKSPDLDDRNLDIVQTNGDLSFTMNPINDYDNQYWHLMELDTGSHRLSTKWYGGDKYLEYYKDDHKYKLKMADLDDSCKQLWKLTKTADKVPGAIYPTNSIPELNPKDNIIDTEGPTDYSTYLKADGNLKAVMIFVDFKDAEASEEKIDDISNRILGDQKAKELFFYQSFGNMELEVVVTNEWKRMNKKSSDYACPDKKYSFCRYEDRKQYVTDAVNLFKHIDFSNYDMTFIVASQKAKLPISPAFIDYDEKKGTVKHAIIFGHDSYRDVQGRLLVHELGHLLGLPDLYPDPDKVPIDKDVVGGWAMMSDHELATGFIGWNRHKLGWLENSRKHYISSGSATLRISPLSAFSGLSMIVVPIDDTDNPSQVYVIEVAQPLTGRGQKWYPEGILIYSVDATKESKRNPVVVQACKIEKSLIYGPMYRAPYRVGDLFQDPGKLSVEVLSKTGNTYSVKVTVP